MPKYKVPFEIRHGSIEIAADTPEHAQRLLGAMTLNDLSGWGELDVGDADEVVHDREGELADKHWDRVKEYT